MIRNITEARTPKALEAETSFIGLEAICNTTTSVGKRLQPGVHFGMGPNHLAECTITLFDGVWSSRSAWDAPIPLLLRPSLVP